MWPWILFASRGCPLFFAHFDGPQGSFAAMLVAAAGIALLTFIFGQSTRREYHETIEEQRDAEEVRKSKRR